MKPERSNAAVWPYACQLQGQAWLEEQAAHVGNMQGLAAGWARRRHEGLAATCRAARELSVCRDPASATKVCLDWWSGIAQRAFADVAEGSNEMLRLAQAGQRTMTALSATAVEAMQFRG